MCSPFVGNVFLTLLTSCYHTALTKNPNSCKHSVPKIILGSRGRSVVEFLKGRKLQKISSKTSTTIWQADKFFPCISPRGFTKYKSRILMLKSQCYWSCYLECVCWRFFSLKCFGVGGVFVQKKNLD